MALWIMWEGLCDAGPLRHPPVHGARHFVPVALASSRHCMRPFAVSIIALVSACARIC